MKTQITEILSRLNGGDPLAAEQLLPVMYEELRRLAAQKLAQEAAGQTLQSTALVHEAYLRLMPAAGAPHSNQPQFDNRGHFFAAASEAMRRILIDRARARRAVKRDAGGHRVDVDLDQIASRYGDGELIEIDSVLDDLAREDADAATIVRLHVFGGFSIEQAGEALDMSRAAAYRDWSYARAWIRQALARNS
jgi:RNA polymerase sigma factor (TIGR02999 family)